MEFFISLTELLNFAKLDLFGQLTQLKYQFQKTRPSSS